MNFFKPSDFGYSGEQESDYITREQAAAQANAKLDKIGFGDKVKEIEEMIKQISKPLIKTNDNINKSE